MQEKLVKGKKKNFSRRTLLFYVTILFRLFKDTVQYIKFFESYALLDNLTHVRYRFLSIRVILILCIFRQSDTYMALFLKNLSNVDLKYLATKRAKIEGIKKGPFTNLTCICDTFALPRLWPFIQKDNLSTVDNVCLD